MAENIKFGFEIDGFKDNVKNLSDLENNFEKLNQKLKGTDFGSDQFKTLQKEIARTSSEIKNVELGMEGLDAEQKASEIKSVAGGFMDMAAGMALVGASNKDMEEVVQTIAQVEGVTRGVTGAMESWASMQKLVTSGAINLTKHTKALFAVIRANPVMALVTAATALVGVISLYRNKADETTAAQKALNEASREGEAAVAKEMAAIASLTVVIEDETASLGAREKAMEDLNKISPEYLGNLDQEAFKTGEAQKAIDSYLDSLRTKVELRVLEDQLTHLIEEEMKKQRELNAVFSTGLITQSDYNEEKKKISKNAVKEQKELLKLIGVRQKDVKETEAQNDKGKEYNETLSKSLDKFKEIGDVLDDKVEIPTEVKTPDKGKTREDFDKWVDETLGSAEDPMEIPTTFGDLTEQKEKRQEYADWLKNLEEDINKFREEQRRKEREAEEAELERQRKIKMSKVELASEAFGAIGNLISSFDAKSEESAKKQFKINKAFSLASALTNTGLAVTAALTAGGNPVKLATGAQFVEAGIAAATGAAQIVKIASSKFQSSGSGGGSGGVGGGISTPSPSQPPAPTANFFGTAGSTGDTSNQTPGIRQQPLQVSVGIDEITNTQNNVTNLEGAASLNEG